MIRKAGEKPGENYFPEAKGELNFNKEGVFNSDRCYSKAGQFREEERLLDLAVEAMGGLGGRVSP